MHLILNIRHVVTHFKLTDYAAACRLHKTGERLNDAAKVQTTLGRRLKRPLLMILLGISQQMLTKLSLGQFASNNR